MTLSTPIFQAKNSSQAEENIRSFQNSPKTLVILAMISAILFWASAFPAISVALSAYTPTEVAFLRYIAASSVLLVYALVKRMPLPRSKDIPAIAFLGLMGFTVYNIALNAGQITVSPGTASFIISSEIGIISLLACLFYQERL